MGIKNMVNDFIPPNILVLMSKIKEFFSNIGVTFYEIRHKQEGKQSYITINISLKIS